MSRASRERSTPVSLVYSAPSLGSTRPGQAPINYYNAFPDLNDVAADRSRSAFPRRAKYSLPLDSEFLPTGIGQVDNELRERDPYLRRLKAHPEIWERLGDISITRRDDQEYPELYRFQKACEISHKRLAATGVKWWLRSYRLAPLYTALERSLALREEILVPLPGDRRGSRLQQQWAALRAAFRATQLVDEAVSLLVGLILVFDSAELVKQEADWVAEQQDEVKGFADFYGQLRSQFPPESCRSDVERDELAERVLQWGKAAFSPKRGMHPRRVRVPAHLAVGYSGLPATVQRLLAYNTVAMDRGKAFAGDDRWPDYAGFELTRGADGGIVLLATSYSPPTSAGADLLVPILDGIPQIDGKPIDIKTGVFIAVYIILLEAMRQQICTGVGLRCPFWDGAKCCRSARPLLQSIYQLAQPWHPDWKHYWQQPPCLA